MESLQRILLISNSTVYGCGYLDHVEQQIKSFLEAPEKFFSFRSHFSTATLMRPRRSALCGNGLLNRNSSRCFQSAQRD
jgi:hypothetical protein